MTNWVDATINAIAPRMGVKRMQARAMLEMFGESTFSAASRTRRSMSGFQPSPKSADGDVGNGAPLMRARSRVMAQNNPIAASAIDTVWTKVIGGGLRLQAKLDWKRAGLRSQEEANEWKDNTESEFRLFAETPECDITRTQNFAGLQALMFRSALESGDSFALLPSIDKPSSVYSLRIQIIEADLVANPRNMQGVLMDASNQIVNGVEMDRYGAPVAYHILPVHPGSTKASMDAKPKRYEAFAKDSSRRHVIHMLDRRRPGQTRGVIFLAPVLEPLSQLGEYTKAELDAAVVNAFLTMVITSPGEGLATTDGSAKRSGDDFRLGSGTILETAPGEDVKVVSATRPNAGFDPFVLAISRQVGAGLGVPFEVLFKHFTSSYSAARAALLEAWHFFKNRRRFVADTFCRPVYEAWMEEAIARGHVSAPGFFDDPAIRAAYLQSEWIGDAPGQINPMDDANAAEKRISIGISDLEDETMQYSGKVWEDIHEQQVKERAMRVRDGLSSPAASESAPGSDPNAPDKKREDANVA